MPLLPTYAPQRVDLRNLYFNTKMPQGPSLTRPNPTLGEKVMNYAARKLEKAGASKRVARKAAALVDFTPVGDAVGAFQAGQDLRQGNWLSGGLGAALAVVPGLPKGGMFGGKLRSILPHNDTGDGLDTIKSLADFLTDPRPLHQMYQTGDMLRHKGEIGEVIHATDDAVVLNLPSGQRIVPRRDRDLDVAPYGSW